MRSKGVNEMKKGKGRTTVGTEVGVPRRVEIEVPIPDMASRGQEW